MLWEDDSFDIKVNERHAHVLANLAAKMANDSPSPTAQPHLPAPAEVGAATAAPCEEQRPARKEQAPGYDGIDEDETDAAPSSSPASGAAPGRQVAAEEEEKPPNPLTHVEGKTYYNQGEFKKAAEAWERTLRSTAYVLGGDVLEH